MNVNITPSAEKFMRRMVRFGAAGGDAGFRLKVSAGGCSGYASEFSVESAPEAGDEVIDVNGLKLFLPAESCPMLEGVTVFFADTPTESGLKFFNPAALPCASCSKSTGPPPVRADISGMQPHA